MWTKLAYVSLPAAFKAQKISGSFQRAPISLRYKNVLKKEFLKNGVPWLFEPVKVDINPRHKTPKGHKRSQEKIVRLDKVKKALIANVEAEKQHIQEHMNNRKLRGMDKFIVSSLGPWLNMKDPGNMSKSDQARLKMIAQIKGIKHDEDQTSELD